MRFALRLLLTRGTGSQNFLGAVWIPFLLRIAPRSRKERLALGLLALSPHYFFRDRYPPGIGRKRFLELERARNDAARLEIRDQVLRPYLEPGFTVLDYGCGPGFLARHVAERVKRVYAGDISPGTIACARIVNPSPAVEYFVAGPGKVPPFPPGSLDLVYSFAVIQHLTDEVFRGLLADFHRWLKPGGRAVLHVVVGDPHWRTEEEWRADRSIRGRLKFHCGLHCFGRDSAAVTAMIRAAGFSGGEGRSIADLARIDDDVGGQDLFVGVKPGGA